MTHSLLYEPELDSGTVLGSQRHQLGCIPRGLDLIKKAGQPWCQIIEDTLPSRVDGSDS